MKDVSLRKWNNEGGRVQLVYEDDTEVYVSKEDFDRAFGCIVSAPKNDVIRDFAIFAIGGRVNKSKGKSEKFVPKIINPKRYSAIIRKLKDHLNVETEDDVIAAGFDRANADGCTKKQRMKTFWSVSPDVGKVAWSVCTHSDNGKVESVNVELPLFFGSDYREVPASKLTEHMDCFLEACRKEIGLEVCMGPFYDIKSFENEESKSITRKTPDKKTTVKIGIPDVGNIIACIGYTCIDPDDNVWEITISLTTVSRVLFDEIEFLDECYVINMRKYPKTDFAGDLSIIKGGGK